MSKQKRVGKKSRIKLLKFCSAGAVTVTIFTGKNSQEALLQRRDQKLKIGQMAEFEGLVDEGLIICTNGVCQTSPSGKMHLKRMLSEIDEFLNQHRQLGERRISDNGIVKSHRTNECESPLARLRFRKTANGNPYIDDPQYQAGERLRADFTKGQLTQRLTSNWNVAQFGKNGTGRRNGMADLTDTALGARSRALAALNAAGPELAGILIDVCCFLKGLERVEKERQWPPRSAKLMLKTGLSILARHYGCSANGPAGSPLRHWGGDNYRPEMFVDENA